MPLPTSLRRRLSKGHAQEAASAAGLKSIGYGSARETFETQDGTALKVLMLESPEDLAANLEWDSELQEAVAQMVNELECLEATQGHPLTPRLLDSGGMDGLPLWIETELLYVHEPFAPAFERSTGVRWDAFTSALSDNFKRGLDPSEYLAAVAEIVGGQQPFFHQLATLVEACPLYLLDMTQADNWGFDATGQIKLLDLGIFD